MEKSCRVCGTPLTGKQRAICANPECQSKVHAEQCRKSHAKRVGKKVCAHCGGPLPPRHHRWCDNPECIEHSSRAYQRYWRKKAAHNGHKRQPDEIRPPYNKKPCARCHRPLGLTFNHYYCKECLQIISSVMCGIEDDARLTL